jgi:hypothetical protein
MISSEDSGHSTAVKCLLVTRLRDERAGTKDVIAPQVWYVEQAECFHLVLHCS